MIVHKELANNQFEHIDLHALPCSGLQQADTRPLSTTLLCRLENVILKTTQVLQILLDGTIFALAFLGFRERAN